MIDKKSIEVLMLKDCFILFVMVDWKDFCIAIVSAFNFDVFILSTVNISAA